MIVFHDVSATRAIGQKMAHLAQHDFLTDLPNRMLFSDRVANAIALARRHGKQRAVLFLDLDRFKHINDSLGHAIGDKLLQSVAQRLVACVRGSDTVSRQGGDEFVVLLSEIERAEDAALSAKRCSSRWRHHTESARGNSISPRASASASTPTTARMRRP